LIPCSAAITVLILCLHLDRFWLGVGLVGAFSIGLAVTLVAAGVVAAVGLRAVARRTNRFDRWLARAPYLSAAIIAVIGAGMIALGWSHLTDA
jgi:nickel/cobalt exporter